LDFDNHARLAECAKQYDVEFLSTPFSPAAVDLLERLNVAAYKIASMDVTHIPLIERVSKTKKPIILSTGMASSEEIKSALSIIDRHQSAVILLHCVSHYPCQEEHAQLNRIKSLQKAFGWNVGYSDHVQGIRAACAAVSMGACVVEKHFTIDRKLPGPDHAMSSDPKELSELVREIRSIEICLGIGKFGDAQSDRDQAPLFRRGIYAAEKILAGELVVPDMIKFVRPETSLRPEDAHKILGKKAVRTIDAETALDMDDVVII
jgi:sialic acid synthase SpsE